MASLMRMAQGEPYVAIEMTDDAEPTMTSPMRQSRTTSRSSSVETESRWLPMRTPRPPAAPRCAEERGATVVALVVRRGRGDVCRWGGAMLRVDVTMPAPSERGRAPQPGPTPDAYPQSPPPRDRSGGPRPQPVPRPVRRRAGRSRELRHREEVPVEDAEAQRAKEAAEDPEADDDGGLGPAPELEVVVNRGHPEDAPVEDA